MSFWKNITGFFGSSDAHLCDIWTMFGGDNFDPLDFGGFSTAGGNDRHPSQRGHIKIGKLIGQIADGIT